MHDFATGRVDDPMPQLPCSEAEIDIFETILEISVEAVELLEQGAANGHAAT
jgi:hypothetical protein